MKNNIINIYAKISRTYYSCNTLEQFTAAKKLHNNFINNFNITDTIIIGRLEFIKQKLLISLTYAE